MNKPIILVGYSGHGLVAADILLQAGETIEGYCDNEEKLINPFDLKFLGDENQFFSHDENRFKFSAFIAVGNTSVRKNIFKLLDSQGVELVNAVHPAAVVSPAVQIGRGVFVAAGATINPVVTLGDGVICNTNCSIDHDCIVGDFSHICPGSVLCGTVTVGNDCMIGAGATVIPGRKITDDVLVGAGSVVIEDLNSAGTYMGSPARLK